MTSKIKIPAQYFGGKRRIASIIWKGFGNISNYLDPFCGGLSTLLLNPNPCKIESINDIDCLLTNFWRAVSKEPEEVAKLCDIPINEIELHARHKRLLELKTSEFKQKMEDDVNFYDVGMAADWIYGQSISIGNNWLQSKGLKALPLLSNAGSGIFGLTYDIQKDFKILQDRLKKVRIVSGDWKRIVTPSVTCNNKGLGKNDVTGVFLDPPYLQSNRDKVYSNDTNVYKEVCEWAITNGDNPRMRIIVCGYDGDFEFPETWKKHHWSSTGGMSALGDGRGKQNSKRETIFFSPNCLDI